MSEDEWVERLTDWMAEVEHRTGTEVQRMTRRSHAAINAWNWLISRGFLDITRVSTGHRPRTEWRLT